MATRRKFELIYAPVVKRHLRAINPKYYSLIRAEIETQLQFEPDVETRNRKRLKRPVLFGATWEIRLGTQNRFRIFYKVNRAEKQREILAIGEKVGKRLFIGGEGIEI